MASFNKLDDDEVYEVHRFQPEDYTVGDNQYLVMMGHNVGDKRKYYIFQSTLKMSLNNGGCEPQPEPGPFVEKEQGWTGMSPRELLESYFNEHEEEKWSSI